jgi:Flp pilus assembly protein TadD
LFDKGNNMRNRVITLLIVVLACTGCQPQQRNSPVKKQYEASTTKVYLPLAQDQYSRGEYESAAESARKVIAATPQMAGAHTILGKSLLALGRNSEAASAFKAAADLDPSSSDAWYGMALLAEQAGDLPAAIHCMETAVACPDASSDIVVHLADAYMSAGEGSKALTLLDTRCRIMGGDPTVMKAAAAANLRLGNPDRAVILYEGLCKTYPKDSHLAETLGYAYVDAGRQSDAAQVFTRLCEANPASPKTYVLLAGECHMKASEYKQAMDLCGKYASSCKDDVSFWLLLGRAAVAARDGGHATYAAKRALAVEPSNPQARTLMGCAQYLEGLYADAIDTFNRLPDKSNAFAWVMKGQCYDRLGDKTEAVSAFRHALAIDPANTAAAKYISNSAGTCDATAGTVTHGTVQP